MKLDTLRPLFETKAQRLSSIQYFTSNLEEFGTLTEMANYGSLKPIDRVHLQYKSMIGDTMSYNRQNGHIQPSTTTIDASNLHKLYHISLKDAPTGDESITTELVILKLPKIAEKIESALILIHVIKIFNVNTIEIEFTNAKIMHDAWNKLDTDLYAMKKATIYSSDKLDKMLLYENKWSAEIKSGLHYTLPPQADAAVLITNWHYVTDICDKSVHHLFVSEESNLFVTTLQSNEPRLRLTDDVVNAKSEIALRDLRELTIKFDPKGLTIDTVFILREELSSVRFITGQNLNLGELTRLGGAVAACNNQKIMKGSFDHAVLCTRK